MMMMMVMMVMMMMMIIIIIIFLGPCGPTWGRASSYWRLLDHTQRRTTVGRTSLDK